MGCVKVAVTGGIGSGKSLVLSIIGSLGYNVISADEIYADMLNNAIFVKKIAEAFPSAVCEGYKLDKKRLSALVFSDSNELKKLNALTHGAVMNEIAFRLGSCDDIAFVEVPVLFENSYECLFDKVIVVLRDKEERIKAVQKRSGLSREEIVSRIKMQYDYENFSRNDCVIINNSGTLNKLQGSVVAAIESCKAGG